MKPLIKGGNVDSEVWGSPDLMVQVRRYYQLLSPTIGHSPQTLDSPLPLVFFFPLSVRCRHSVSHDIPKDLILTSSDPEWSVNASLLVHLRLQTQQGWERAAGFVLSAWWHTGVFSFSHKSLRWQIFVLLCSLTTGDIINVGVAVVVCFSAIHWIFFNLFFFNI